MNFNEQAATHDSGGMRIYHHQNPSKAPRPQRTCREKEKQRKLRQTLSQLKACQAENKLITEALRCENESLRRAIAMEREDNARKVKLVEERTMLKSANETVRHTTCSCFLFGQATTDAKRLRWKWYAHTRQHCLSTSESSRGATERG